MILSSKASLFIAVLGCFLLAPSKVAAVAYALLLGGMVIFLFVGLGIIGALGGWVQRLWRS